MTQILKIHSYYDMTLSPITAWHQLDVSAALPSVESLAVYTVIALSKESSNEASY